jgi:hypothetical protein
MQIASGLNMFLRHPWRLAAAEAVFILICRLYALAMGLIGKIA